MEIYLIKIFLVRKKYKNILTYHYMIYIIRTIK